MRTRKPFLALAAGAMLAGGAAFAQLLGLIPEVPSILAPDPTGTTTYNATTQFFSVETQPLAILFELGGTPAVVQPTGDPPIRVLTIDIQVGSGGVLLGGLPGDDDLLIIGKVDANGDGVIDYDGILLTGEILAFGFLNVGLTDKYDFRFNVTGGLLSPYFAGKDLAVLLTSENSTFAGSFDEDFEGGAKAVLGPVDEIGLHGCTPGYWKQPQHFFAYTPPYTPTTLFEDVFERDVPGDPTLVEALSLGGGGLNALMRHATAALLNAAHPDIHPDPLFSTPFLVILAFQIAYDTGEFEFWKDLMEASNELGCPIGNEFPGAPGEGKGGGGKGAGPGSGKVTGPGLGFGSRLEPSFEPALGQSMGR